MVSVLNSPNDDPEKFYADVHEVVHIDPVIDVPATSLRRQEPGRAEFREMP